MIQKVFRSYSYVILGPEKVGKTNIITRFTKDEFTQTHNLTLEGQQNATLSLDGRIFQVTLQDTAGQQNMQAFKAVWKNNKNGFIYTYSINNLESYQWVMREILADKKNPIYKNVAIILVGNKIDLQNERRVPRKTVSAEANTLGIKYFQVSAKTSSKDDIDALICELIEINEMQRYNITKQQTNGYLDWHPCEDRRCQIM